MSGRSAKVFRSLGLAGLLIFMAMQGTALWAASPIDRCGVVIFSSGEYVLTQDLLQCEGNGIIIVADHVTLNLNGHNLTGTGPDYSGILVGDPSSPPVSNVRIVGPSTISNFGAGITLVGAEHTSVRMVTAARNNGYGFWVLGFGRLARFNTFENNMAISNQNAGFEIIDAEENTFRDNISTMNQFGFHVAPIAHENRIESNTVTGNSDAGIFVQTNATRNVIHGNTAHDNPGYDLFEGNPNCDNAWANNSFGTANNPCIR